MRKLHFLLLLITTSFMIGCGLLTETGNKAEVILTPSVTDESYIIITNPPTDIPTHTPTLKPTPTSTPSPSPTPTPTPSPTPTPKGLIGGKYNVFNFDETPINDETQYKTNNISITVTTYNENPYNKSKLVYYVADIYIQNLTSLRTSAVSSFKRSNTSKIHKIATSVDALIAINGDYYSHAKGLLIRNGEIYNNKIAKRGDICLLFKDGTMETIPTSKFDNNMDLSIVWQAWQFGPYLIEEDGSPRTNFSGSGIFPLNPRTVIGYYEPGHYCFVVVDGRRSKSHSAGLTLDDLAQLMVDLGCTKAYNMDGGASSQLYWNSEVFNRPSGDSLRAIPDIIYIGEPFSDEESDIVLATPSPLPMNEISDFENIEETLSDADNKIEVPDTSEIIPEAGDD